MQSPKYFALRFVIIVDMALLIACTSNTTTPQNNDASEPSPTTLATETLKQTTVPTDTVTSTLTPEPTATETPSITPSPTPNMVMPGTFLAGGCGTKEMSQGGSLVFCVSSVTVDADRHLIFDVSWTLSGIPSGFTVTKKSDQDNKKMYLIDNLGNRYNHSAGGGAAYTSIVVTDGDLVSGWFDFGQPPVGAFTFDLHDDDNNIVIGGISLVDRFRAPSIHYQSFDLDPYPLSLNYQEELWQPSTLQDGTILLVSKTIPFCTFRAASPAPPKGEFKNNGPIGSVTFDIYGYFDDGIGLFVREYIYSSGFTGLDPNLKPLFIVTIPGDNSLACILDSSTLLLSLSIKTP